MQSFFKKNLFLCLYLTFERSVIQKQKFSSGANLKTSAFPCDNFCPCLTGRKTTIISLAFSIDFPTNNNRDKSYGP